MTKLTDILDDGIVNDLKTSDLPNNVSFMLATLTDEYFDDENWIYERKLDGQRVMIQIDESRHISLLSRNHKILNKRYPEIVKAFQNQAISGAILDTEIVAFEDGVTSFSKLQKRMHLEDETTIKNNNIKVYCYIFDILYIDNYDIRALPLKTRKKLLKEMVQFGEPIHYVQHIKQAGKTYLKEACEKNWEGIIAKDYDSKYLSSRSKKWLKFKCINRQEFVIIGYTDPSGKRIGFGALLVGYFEHQTLQYAGKVGTGYTNHFLDTFINDLRAIEQSSSPLQNIKTMDTHNVHWVKPKYVAEVTFTEWTENSKLRHPSFIGLRDDKPINDIHKESGE
ncbi:MAG: non-homologous end-joining DNA ligase [Candidatus Izemoplasma sp.]|nr:non-homologous end-joining DNA ligase [Candidatus Izemoplasma sp.]